MPWDEKGRKITVFDHLSLSCAQSLYTFSALWVKIPRQGALPREGNVRNDSTKRIAVCQVRGVAWKTVAALQEKTDPDTLLRQRNSKYWRDILDSAVKTIYKMNLYEPPWKEPTHRTLLNLQDEMMSSAGTAKAHLTTSDVTAQAHLVQEERLRKRTLWITRGPLQTLGVCP